MIDTKELAERIHDWVANDGAPSSLIGNALDAALAPLLAELERLREYIKENDEVFVELNAELERLRAENGRMTEAMRIIRTQTDYYYKAADLGPPTLRDASIADAAIENIAYVVEKETEQYRISDREREIEDLAKALLISFGDTDQNSFEMAAGFIAERDRRRAERKAGG